MITLTRRSAFAAFAATLIAPVLALAQGATNGPAGGIPSTAAPSNSEGTPAGGTGVVGNSRTTTRAPAPASPTTPLVGGEAGTSESTMPRHRRRRRVRRHTRTVTPSTSQ